MARLNMFLIAMFAASLFVLGDVISTKWARDGNNNLLILIFIIGPFAYICQSFMTKKTSLAVASGMVNTLIVVGSILAAILLFRDPISIRQYIGLFFGILTVILLV